MSTKWFQLFSLHCMSFGAHRKDEGPASPPPPPFTPTPSSTALLLDYGPPHVFVAPTQHTQPHLKPLYKGMS